MGAAVGGGKGIAAPYTAGAPRCHTAHMRLLHALLLACLLGGCAVPRDDDDATPVPQDDDDATGDDDDATGDDDTAGDDDDATGDLGTIDGIVAALGAATPTEADAVLHAVAWSQGWPVQEGTRWLFVTRIDGASSVALVGDFNLWNLGAHPASSTAGGAFWWAEVDESEFVAPPAGGRYKWYLAAGGGEFRAGDEATAYGYDEFGPFGYVAPPTDTRWAERFPALLTAALPLPRTVRGLLPPGFQPGSPSAGRTRTILMHDGQNLFDPEAIGGGWRVDEALNGEAAWDDVVVLAVDNAADRLDVYGHVPDDIFDDGSSYGGRSGEYLALLADEVLPFARGRYGLVATGASLAMAGSSMGGLVTLEAARRWDGTLGCAAALSPTLGWGAFGTSASGAAALVNQWPDDPGHGSTPLFLYSGGSEGNGCVDTDGDGVDEDSQDSDGYCVNVQFRDMLAGLGYVFEADLWHWWEPLAQHNEAAWAAQVSRMLTSCEASGWVAAQP